MSVKEAQYKITSSEFTEWIQFLSEEPGYFHREDYYWAQIAAEIRRGNVKQPSKVKIKDFILQFISESDKPEMTKEEATKQQKTLWKRMLSIKE